MGPLNKYDAFLILVTAPVSCTMPVAPQGIVVFFLALTAGAWYASRQWLG